jgi:hypothetical protein
MRASRAVVVAGLAVLLVGLCVGYGALPADPAEHRYPGNGALAAGDLGAGERVVLSGTVRIVGSDRVVLGLRGDGSRVTLRGLGGDPAPGDDVWLYGSVRADGDVAVERAVVRAPWEIAYLYAVSLVGGLLTLHRVRRTWRFDRDRCLLVPREGGDG